MTSSNTHQTPNAEVKTRAPLYAVIMAGGAGERLWPESRAARPKPFLPLARNGESLIRATYERLDSLVPHENRLVVAGRAFENLARKELPELRRDNLLLEPCGRDTAPCVAWAAFEIARRDPDAVMIVLPSDHVVHPVENFRSALARAVELVHDDPTRLVALGIRPRETSTAFGYIERGEKIGNAPNAFRVREFEEKPNVKKVAEGKKPSKLLAKYAPAFQENPDPDVARKFLESQDYLWNAGVFVWRAATILKLIRSFEPELAETVESFEKLAARDSQWRDSREFDALFARAKKISIDYAVLERATNVAVVATDDFEWNDLGSFNALAEIATEQRDERGNLCQGARLVATDASGVHVRASGRGKKLVVVSGLDNLLVVETEDALLVARKGDASALKKIVEQIRAQGLDEFL